MNAGVVTFVVTVVALPLLLSEFGDWCPWLAERVVKWAARRLGDPLSCERYEEEWIANLNEVPGKVTRLVAAFGYLAYLPSMRRSISRQARATEPVSAGQSVVRQLPSATPAFTGRAEELAVLDGVLDTAASGWTTGTAGTAGVVISAIGGTAGVGKTALALHWAHRVADRFPDGQLYANLRGLDAGSGDPADVLRGFLDTLGVHPERLPADAVGLAALYRSVIAGRRMLVLLDDAADVAQVRPLLPASPGCLVIVTSGRALEGRAAQEGLQLLQLDVLTRPEAEDLLTSRLGRERVTAEPSAVTELADLCGRLPLALRVTAEQAAARPHLPLSSLVAELTEAGERLDGLYANGPAANVRTVFSWSYRALPVNQAQMFRLLSIHPGPEISVAAAASLAGVSLTEAKAALQALERAHMVTEAVPGRFAFHDLLRAHAAEQAGQDTPTEVTETARRRMLDHYLHTAHAAHQVLYPGRELIDLDPCAAGVTPETFGGKASALGWLEDEYQVLLKVSYLAAREGIDAHAWRLPVVLWTFHNVCGHWHDGTRLHRLALEAARRNGDLSGQAHALRGLGSFAMSLGAFEEAHECLIAAQEAFRELGDDLGLARTDVIFSQTLEFQGRFAEALAVMDDALRLSESAPGDRHMMLVRASALNGSAWNHVQRGDLSVARALCLKAIELCQSIGYTPGEAGTWDTLGVVLQRLGSHEEAAGCFLRAVSLDREMGNRYDLAMVLAHLGETYAATGDLPGAREAWEESLLILRALHHPAASTVRARLAALVCQHAAAPDPRLA